MTSDFQLAEDTEITKRREALLRFIKVMIEPGLGPLFVSDVATVYDVVLEMPEDILAKIAATYHITLKQKQLEMPLWQLLDLLEGKKM